LYLAHVNTMKGVFDRLARLQSDSISASSAAVPLRYPSASTHRNSRICWSSASVSSGLVALHGATVFVCSLIAKMIGTVARRGFVGRLWTSLDAMRFSSAALSLKSYLHVFI
jgi:hypothetical protein